MEAHRATELTARQSYGKLVAYLAVRTQDVATAEDALGEAFLTALKTWPAKGIPRNPEVWLLVSARRKLIDQSRRSQTHVKALKLLNLEGFTQDENDTEFAETTISFADERLKLLFICAHPAIDAKLHTPLMLQTVLGLNAAQIASAFLVAPTTMSQRLVRVKAKIRDAGISFELPTAEVLEARSQSVLQAIYAAYSTSWQSNLNEETGSDLRLSGLTTEAIWLAKLCLKLMPNEPEAHGLLALMLYCESRRSARRQNGKYVPLLAQDTSLWSQPMIAEAETALKQAASYKRLGRFQLEAAIQSIHAQRTTQTASIDWQTLVQLYEGLLQLSPTVGALLGKAAAIAQAKTPDAGLALLNTLPSKTIQNHQPYWALKAHLLRQTGQLEAAKSAYSQAIGLTEDISIRNFLLQQSASM
ncbi:MAG: DUF6596 domain-containing protein [Cyanobacteria bacterium J06632_3]